MLNYNPFSARSDPFFNSYYNNARVNSILIMDCDGFILNVNQAFTNHYGYSNEDIVGQNFSLLFTENDRLKMLPELELTNVIAKGQTNDENYVINKDGQAIWSLGESLLISDPEGVDYIVKDIVNLQAKRYLEFFLTDTEELLEKIFESSKDIPMIILDNSMKVLKVNKPFLTLFNLAAEPATGSRLAELASPFWQSIDIMKEMRSIIIKDSPFRDREFVLETKAGEQKMLRFNSRIIESKKAMQIKIFITIQEMPA